MSIHGLSGIAMLHAYKDMHVDTETVDNDFAQGRNGRLVFLFSN